MLAEFLDPTTTSLKICGVTTAADAEKLASLGVEALGANFWPSSKRYLDPSKASFLHELAGKILRVGVFVNSPAGLTAKLFDSGLIDVVQLHGDEPDGDIAALRAAGIPVIRATSLAGNPDPGRLIPGVSPSALLLDAHAPGVYGGTGEMIDWHAAAAFIKANHGLPVILAGGITPENAARAIATTGPAAIDVASGAESSPGIKDFAKVRALLDATKSS